MAAKKYKPALFELVSKNSSSPRKGSLQTPKWFYQKSKKAAQTVEKPEQSELTDEDALSEQPQQVNVDAAIPTAVMPEHETETPMFSGLTFSVSYRVLALAALALVFLLLVAFQLGRNSATPNYIDAPPGTDMQQIVESPANTNLVTPSAQGGSQPATAQPRPIPTAQSVTTQNTAPAQSSNAAAARTGQCLIICSLAEGNMLRPLQQHFANSGIMTEIGYFNNTYVLHSSQTFESSQAPGMVNLRQNVIRVGATYNESRPAGAPVISANTFQSAYPANIAAIETIDR
ncbi:MAG: hypothetical protein JW936_07235 [Sedimentisphaerales bacterium]|nr:hypothetical protein [Sedimentisphaerales bacterium]